MAVKSAKEFIAYQKAYRLAMEVFELSKLWPKDEKYSLTDQIRRSSRSVCANLREAWAKRRYEAHFLSLS
jgi:four helix bundle protein